MIKNKILLSPPHMNQKERSMLLEAFDSGWIAPLGPHIALMKECTPKI